MLDKERISRWPVARRIKDAVLHYGAYLEDQGLPIIFDAVSLSDVSGFSSDFISRVQGLHTKFYRPFKIKKRRGGFRDVVAPTPSLKALQKWIAANLFQKLYRTPGSVHGFVQGRSIISNATAHRGNAFMLKLDINNFFGSIKRNSIENVLLESGYSPRASDLISRICCYCGYLPQGSPASPVISNLFMRSIDNELERYCKSSGYSYTRYSDDITISSPRDFSENISYVKNIISKSGLTLNQKKELYISRDCRKVVTGIDITNGNLMIPAWYKKRIRRDIYFIVNNGAKSHMQHRLESFGDIFEAYRYFERIRGQLAFIVSVETGNKDAKAALDDLNNIDFVNLMPV